MTIGFVLDGIGDLVEVPYIGIGRPLMKIIEAPVKYALVKFYDKRMKRLQEDSNVPGSDAQKATAFHPIKMRVGRNDVARLRGVPPEQVPESEIEIEPLTDPLGVNGATHDIDNIVRPR